MRNLIIIVAIGKNNELGKKSDLIWKIKGDMAFFKEKTMGHTLVMGSNTFFSLPKLLPGRKHIVLTHSKRDIFPSEVTIVHSLEEFDTLSKSIDDDIYVIGGASIYSQFLDKADYMYLTEIDAECKSADVYFPVFDKDDYNIEVLEEHSGQPSYKHLLYTKKHR